MEIRQYDTWLQLDTLGIANGMRMRIPGKMMEIRQNETWHIFG